MIRRFLKINLIFILILLPFCSVLSAEPLSVVINEIAWMGTGVSYNDEWIELYNTTENNINIEGWMLKADDGTPEINLTGIIPAQSFYLLERTDDETVPGILADLIYKGALGNDGENLKLYDNLGKLIDEVSCKNGWLAGDNKTKQTMERLGDATWQASAEPGGTPKTENPKQITKLPEARPRETKKEVEAGPLSFEDEGETAAIGEKIIKTMPEKSSNRGLLPLLIAFIIAIFSAGIILFLKKSSIVDKNRFL